MHTLMTLLAGLLSCLRGERTSDHERMYQLTAVLAPYTRAAHWGYQGMSDSVTRALELRYCGGLYHVQTTVPILVWERVIVEAFQAYDRDWVEYSACVDAAVARLLAEATIRSHKAA